MDAIAFDCASIRLSTGARPEPEFTCVWREEIERRLVYVEIEPISDRPIHAEVTLLALPGLRLMAWSGSAIRMRRTASHVADGDDAVGLIANMGRSARLSQRGREVVLGTGDAAALLHSETASLENADAAVAPCECGSHLALVVPRSALASRIGDLEDASMRAISRRRGSLRLLVSYLQAVRKQWAFRTPELQTAVVGHVHELVALAIRPDREAANSTLSAISAARLEAALGYVAAHVQDPELSVATVARSQGISPRHLQRLLEESGTPFTARVNELRLQRAFELLATRGEAAGRVSDVALQVGFSDISHFNRLFRSRFGDTPTGVRGQGANVAEAIPAARHLAAPAPSELK
jgi:AraC-like DNA-binding protein